MTDQIDLHHRGMTAAAHVIDAAGTKPYDCEGVLLVPAEPTEQYWQAELDDLGREEFTEIESEELLDGWHSVMGPWRELVDDGADVPDATRQVAGQLLEDAAGTYEPAAHLQAARALLGLSRKAMSQRMGVPVTGRQAPTLRKWEAGDRKPQDAGRAKIREMAEDLR